MKLVLSHSPNSSGFFHLGKGILTHNKEGFTIKEKAITAKNSLFLNPRMNNIQYILNLITLAEVTGLVLVIRVTHITFSVKTRLF